MKIIQLGDWDDDVDVAVTPDGWLVAGVPIISGKRQPLRLQTYDRTGKLLIARDVFTGTDAGGNYPRLMPGGDRIWLAHRALTNDSLQATVRRVDPVTLDYETVGVFGPADGPLALSGDGVAWQNIAADRVYGVDLRVPGADKTELRAGGWHGGLSHLDGWWPIHNDENRDSIAGMEYPVRRYGLVVGQHRNGGIVAAAGGPHGRLLSEQITGKPRGAARQPNDYAATCWGGPGARLVLFNDEDIRKGAA